MTTPHDAAYEETLPLGEATAAKGRESRGVEQIEADIEQTRQELGQTVEALGAKLDVKTRAKERISAATDRAGSGVLAARVKAAELTERAKDTTTDEQGRLRPAIPVAVSFVAVATVALVIWRRRHR